MLSASRLLNKRAALIIAALALPVVVFVVMKPAPTTPPVARGAMSTAPQGSLPPLDGIATNSSGSLDAMRAKIKRRLGELERMSDEQWEAERKSHPNRPASIKDAIDFNTRKLQELEHMTQEQWDAQQAQAVQDAPGKPWEALTAQEKLLIIEDQQKKLEQVHQQLLMQAEGPGKTAPTK